MKKISKLCAVVTSANLFATMAFADGCMRPEDKTALKIETLQQELMVAALICDDATPYNAFVIANRPELQSSDRDLQDFYSKLYQTAGTAQFQTVKTRLANHFSLDSLHDQKRFCQNANALFANMHGRPDSLATQVSWMSVSDTKESCERGAPIVETIEGGSGGLPQTRVAKKDDAPAARQRDDADDNYDDADEPPAPQQRVAQNAYPQPPRYANPRGYYAPQPNPYYQTPAYYYPPNYYPGYGR